jgi:ribosomal RNA-processing protein 12
LTHIHKLSERAARQKAARQQGPENNHFDNLMESDEEDSDDGRTLMTGATGLTKMTGHTGRSVRSAAMDKSTTGQQRGKPWIIKASLI